MSARSTKRRRAGGRGAGAPAPASSTEALARVFAALGDATRLKLVAVLCAGGALSIAELTTNTAITRQGVTKHLQVLADAGVVRDEKLGRERRWQIEPEQIEEARRTLEIIGRQWEVALGRLKAFTESRRGPGP